jgi:hypothetical protein
VYSTCLFCHSSLGANECVEHFPVGRRLAFDEARGRLWVVCRKCERWNLSPLEERWEAIEDCERLFSGTRLRLSTDNIGLARVGDGLELVRIGSPLRPEMAAWRYGDQFGRRRRKHLIWTGAGIAAAAGLIILGPVTGMIAGGTLSLWNLGNVSHQADQRRRLRARVRLPDRDRPVNIRRKHLWQIGVVPLESGWGLRIPHEIPWRQGEKSSLKPVEHTTVVEGADALRAAAALLPAMNEAGATRTEVHEAVRMITEVSEPSSLFERYAGIPTDPGRRLRLTQGEHAVLLAGLPKEIKLALEMATHEDSERRALEGELETLEDAWRVAEEIASIADDLFVTDETRARLSQLKSDAETR